MVAPEEVDDIAAQVLARDITKQIEEELTYPGQIKVTRGPRVPRHRDRPLSPSGRPERRIGPLGLRLPRGRPPHRPRPGSPDRPGVPPEVGRAVRPERFSRRSTEPGEPGQPVVDDDVDRGEDDQGRDQVALEVARF